MKHDKSNTDLDKGMNMPGSTGSQGSQSGSQSGSQGNPSRGNLEESEVGASSRGSQSGSQSGSSGSGRTGFSGSSGSSNQGTSGSSSSSSRSSDNRESCPEGRGCGLAPRASHEDVSRRPG